MSQNLPAPAVVPDVNILIALCSNEQLTCAVAEAAFEKYVRDGWAFFAPNIIAAEVLYVLCQKLAQEMLTETEHEQAVELFINYMNAVAPPDGGDFSLIKRAEEIRALRLQSLVRQSLYCAGGRIVEDSPDGIADF